MLKVTYLSLTASLMALIGIGGCSMFSASNAPVDCNVVKTQTAAGQTDEQIASNLGAKESDVAACHGPMSSGNSSAGDIPKSY